MYKRLKELRSALNMNQSDFAKSLGIGQSTLAMMEVGKREIGERHIKTICAIYNVNEAWLKTGIGDVFTETPSTITDELKRDYELDEMDVAIIESYLNLNKDEKAAVKKYIRSITGLISAPSREDIIKTDIELTEKRLTEMSHINK